MTTGDDAKSEPEPKQYGEPKRYGDGAEASAPVVSRQGGDGVEVLILSGELDLNTVEEIVPVLEAALAAHPGSLVLDLSRVRFADSSALNLLLRTHARTSLHLAGPLQPVVKRLFEITGITGVLNLHDTHGEAIEAAQAKR
ncbi:MAG TPA: STAS domain-containing protein [Streptomyces sp.]|nr:STAS domain-containing protein [Streptomyces sp.]